MGDFFQAVKELKHSKPSPQVCPVCGSIRIRQQGSLSGWLLPAVYVCEECGYVGRVVVELEKE